MNVVKVGDAWAMRTSADLGFLMSRETVETRNRLRAAIETWRLCLSSTRHRAEIEEIRGVSVNRGTIDQLIEMEWIKFGRRKMTPGRPVTFVVTPPSWTILALNPRAICRALKNCARRVC